MTPTSDQNLRAVQAERWAAALYRIRVLLRRYWWVILLTTTVGLGVAGFKVSREQTWYRSSAQLMVSGRVQVTEGNAYSEDLGNFYGTQMELMKSSKVTAQAEARVQAQGQVAPSVISSYEISMLPNTSIFVLKATAQTADYSQAFLDAAITEYMSLKRSMRTEKSETTMAALTEEVQKQDRETEAAESELETFLKTQNVSFLREGGSTAGDYAAQLNKRLAELSTESLLLNQLEVDQLRGLKLSGSGSKASADSPEGSKEPEVPQFIAQSEYLKAQQNLELLEQKKSQLTENLRSDHPDVVALDEQIAEQKRLLNTHRELAKNELTVRRQSLASQIKVINQDMESWKSKALDLSKAMAEYNRLQAKLERSKALYERLLANMGNIDMTKNLSQDVVSVLARPSAAESVRPGMGRTLSFGSLIGFFVGVVILYLLDRSNAEIASPEEFISGFEERLLGIVPLERDAGKVLETADSRHAFAEAFFNIRSSLFFLPYEGAMPKTLLITSSVPDEGKSTLSVNVALAFAFAGSRTLLIDGDLRRGEIHRKFDLPNEKGFSDLLQKSANWKDTILTTSTPNLSIMPRGCAISQPSKYLVHNSTDALLQELHEDYDQIIIDSCPVLAADDTTSLAPKVEAVLVVVRVGFVHRRHVVATLASLRARQANVLGCMLNGVDAKMSSYSYHSYTKYYTAEAKAGI